MNKKLLAVAVAGALVAPTAFAQSSVTISGFIKGGLENMKYNQSAKLNNGQTGLADDSSRIIFNVVEDLGGGLQAIAQMDMRIKIDDQGATPAALTGAQNTGNLISGNSHVGLRSKDWGRIFMGRQDLHYFNTENSSSAKNSLRADSISILAFTAGGAGGTQAIAGATRTQNVIHYTTPNWGGFTMIAAYSSNPGGFDGDINSGVRKGRAWNLNPNFAGSNWQVGYSYWSSKNDAGANTIAAGDQRADRLYGSYAWGGFKLGFAWDKSKIKGALNGLELANRNAWSIPLSYTWGNHTVWGHYDKARADKASVANAGSVQAGNGNLDSSAKMWAIGYAYDLSKRTSVGLTYAKITNAAGANYNFFTNTSLGLGNAAAANGEDPRLMALTLRHAF